MDSEVSNPRYRNATDALSAIDASISDAEQCNEAGLMTLDDLRTAREDFAALVAADAGRITGWRMVDGVRVFTATAGEIAGPQEFVRFDDYKAARPSAAGDAVRLREALADLVRAGKAFRNTVVETRGVRGMDTHDTAISAAEAALTGAQP